MGILSLILGKDYEDINSDQLKEMFKKKDKYQFIDVRTKQEYKNRRVKQFNKNIDYYKFIRNQSMLDRISMDKAVVFICETGARSNGACRMMTKRGHKEVYNFKRGIRVWDGPIVK